MHKFRLSGFSYFSKDGRTAVKSIWIVNSLKEHLQFLSSLSNSNGKGLSVNLMDVVRCNPEDADVALRASGWHWKHCNHHRCSIFFFFYFPFSYSSDRKNGNPPPGFWKTLLSTILQLGRMGFPYVLTQAGFGNGKKMLEGIYHR